MIHLVLWFNIFALLAFLGSLPMMIVMWVRGLYHWTRTALWYLVVLVFYQLLFTFRFFCGTYIGNIPYSIQIVFEIISVLSSAAALLLLVLLVLRYLGGRTRPLTYVAAALPGVLLLLAMILILFFDYKGLIKPTNTTYYFFVTAVSLYGFMKSRGLHIAREARVVRYLLLIHVAFNLYFVLYSNVRSFNLPDGIPGIILVVPLYILSWAILLIIWSAMSLSGGRDASTVVPEVFSKNYELSPRETEIVSKLVNGKSNREISRELFISVRTVDTHIYNIYRKCSVKSRMELVKLIGRY